MRALVLQSGFGFENLQFMERPDPEPGPGEILVRVRAVSLNYRDLLIVKGLYNPRLGLPRILGSDAAGEVVALGPGVKRFKVGDRVAGCFFQDWVDGPLTEAAAQSALGGEIDGVFAEHVLFAEQGVVAIPPDLSDVEAATLPCAALTAWNALQQPPIAAGETILVLGTGGVSLFALQFAVAAGARVLITSKSDEKLQRALALGALDGLNYRQHPDWHKWARERSGGGVDRVIEVGGAGTLEQSLKAVKYGGHIPLVGVLAGPGTINPTIILMRGITLRGIFVGSRAMFEQMNQFLARHLIHPVIDRTFPFDQAIDALHYLESAAHFGKVVVTLR